ncbi:MAG: CPBP family intramembrane metalloprotease [Rubrobacter sp.]|nr:CPBP family intramembrane metalloprotease [Rubrobacter sp.]
MKRLASKYPVVFSLAVVGVLFIFTYIGRAMYPVVVVGDLTQLDPSAFEPPTQFERMLSTFQSAEGVFDILAIVFAAALLTWLGWWREAGFTARCKNLPLALPPLVIAAIALSDGVRVPDGFGQIVALLVTTALAVFAEEIVFRGLMWRALVHRGPILAAALTAVLSGIVVYGINATGGPVPEARFITALTLCGSFAYAAIRWRCASIWPVIGVHFLVALAIAFANLGSSTYQFLLYAGTIGFIIYGLFLLRTARVRADGG